MSKRYAFNDGSEDFIVEVDDIHHARETAELYNAQITGIMYEPYGEVNFNERDDDQLEVKFKYNMLENPNKVEENQDMMNFMGDILVELL